MFKRLSLILFLGLNLGLLSCSPGDPLSVTNLPDFVACDRDRLVLSQGDMRLTITPQIAARVVSLKVGDHEIMYQAPLDRHPHWGTVLWSSPQAEWGWPPVQVLDSQPYGLQVHKNSLEFISAIDSRLGYQFSKTYQLAGDNAFAVTYKIYNRGTQTKRVGALEVTRYPAEGEMLFPQGETTPVSGIFYPLKIQMDKGLVWFAYDPKAIRKDHHKVMMDGKEGWVAYRDRGYMVIKQFADSPPEAIAEGEREIELFAHMDHTFIEVKQQSAAETLAPGQFLTWTVIWRALKLPKNLQDDVPPEALADFVRAQLR